MHVKRRQLFCIFSLSIFILAIMIVSFIWLVSGLPSLDTLPTRFFVPSIRIVDRNGQLLYESIPSQGGRHTVVSIDSIPLDLRQATIATEDRSFYTNPGVDLWGIL